MSIRAFEQTFKDRRRMIVVTCGKCGFIGERKRPFMRLSLNETDRMVCQQVTRQFERDGWTIGARAQEDRCPACNAAMKQKPKLTVIPKEPEAMTAMPQAANDPREMSRDDGRVIFAKLEDVYDTNRAGYRSGWTDQKLATDLGVPRAWVEAVRKQFFGPEGGNPEIAAALAEAKALVEEARPLLAKLEALKAAMGSAQAEAQKIAAKVEIVDRRIAAIEKAVRS